MQWRVLQRKLKVLGEKANAKFPELNAGGCCVFAAAVAKELENLGLEAWVTFPKDNDKEELLRLVEDVKKKKFDGPHEYSINLWHLAVRIRHQDVEYAYDSDGLVENGKRVGNARHIAHRDCLSSEEAEVLANEVQLWNSFFPRQQIPAVRKLVREELSA